MVSPIVEERYRPWSPACDEYFNQFTDGRHDAASRLWFVLPRAEIQIDRGRDALVLGRAGCDGIEFCLRRDHAGVWAYYPIEKRWVLKAASLMALECGWLDGSIFV